MSTHVLDRVSSTVGVPPVATRWRRALAGVAVIIIPALAGTSTALSMPHGPATGAQALATLAACFGVGRSAGWALSSAWAILPAAISCGERGTHPAGDAWGKNDRSHPAG